MWLFHYFNFERNYDLLKSKSPWILLNKNINFSKNETESKMENLQPVLERRTLRFSSFKNRKLKIKPCWAGARERKKRVFFVPFILSKGNFLKNLCFISVYIVLNTIQKIHTFTYQKTLLHTLLCLFLKSSKTFSVSLCRR